MGETFYPFWQRVAFGSYAFTEYIVKTLIPINLFYLYLFPISIGEPLPLRFYVYPVAIIVMVVLFFRQIIKNPTILCGLLFFILHIGLTLHIVPMSRISIMADRYIYLASIGLFFILSYWLVLFFTKELANKTRILLIGVYILFLSVSSFHRIQVWKDDGTLKQKFKELSEQYKADENRAADENKIEK